MLRTMELMLLERLLVVLLLVQMIVMQPVVMDKVHWWLSLPVLAVASVVITKEHLWQCNYSVHYCC